MNLDSEMWNLYENFNFYASPGYFGTLDLVARIQASNLGPSLVLNRFCGNTGAMPSSNEVRQARSLGSHSILPMAVSVMFLLGTWQSILEIVRIVSRKAQHVAQRALFVKSGVKSGVDMYRNVFMDLPSTPLRIPSNHTHGKAAADRTSASNFAEAVAKNCGLSPFYHQMSRSDQRRNRNGSRSWFWTKDLTAEPRDGDLNESKLHIMIDVDYYVDMKNFLSDKDTPTLLYTFQPTAVAGKGEDFVFSFGRDDVVDYKVSGGGRYEHKVWNYSRDHLCIRDYLWGFIPWTVSHYLVDRRPTHTPHHELVLLTPISRWTGLYAWLAWFVEGATLERFLVNRGDYNLLETMSTEGHRISVGIPEQSICATIDADTYHTIINIAQNTKNTVTPPTIEGNLGLPTTDPQESLDRKHMSYVLTGFARSEVRARPAVFCPATEGVRRVQFGTFEEDAKPNMQAYMQPIIKEGYAHDKTVGNDQQAVNSRIKNVASAAEMDPFLDRVMDEFLELVFPVPHSLTPVDVEEVFERQPRPTQRNILHEACFSVAKRLAKVFVKSEAYSKAADPRIISTINGVDKLNYSRYHYAIADHLKTQPWYAFGKTPKQVAERVGVICGLAQLIMNCDFSRFDGTMTEVTRTLERRALMRAFSQLESAFLHELHSSGINLNCVTREGVKYKSGFARLSGSPETSTFNSLINAFVIYVAYRRTKINGVFMGPTEAWAKLNEKAIVGGDDGTVADLDDKAYAWAVKRVGLTATVEQVPRGSFGVSFLARMYGPDVWYGDINSTCDVVRQLSKIHMCTMKPNTVTSEDILIDRARAFLLSDAQTPIIGPLVTKVAELAGIEVMERQESTHFNARYGSEQFPNDVGPWAFAYAMTVLPGFDWTLFANYLGSCTSVSDCLKFPLCQDILPTPARDVVVVVDDETILPVKSKPKAPAVPPQAPAVGGESPPRNNQGPSAKPTPSPGVVPKPRATRRGGKKRQPNEAQTLPAVAEKIQPGGSKKRQPNEAQTRTPLIFAKPDPLTPFPRPQAKGPAIVDQAKRSPKKAPSPTRGQAPP